MHLIHSQVSKNIVASFLLSAIMVATCTAPCTAKPTAEKKAASISSAISSANWYPSSVALPAGLNYPCNLTGLPPAMDGIPAGDRVFINHTYAMILKSVQAKIAMVSRLTKGSARNAYPIYYAITLSTIKTIRAEPTPRGLETFRNQVLQALILQMKFFEKASAAAEAGQDFNTIMQIPEGRQASSQLQAAWSQMKSRYASLGRSTEDSMYHHLCALDLF
jgi:hypothetical protein